MPSDAALRIPQPVCFHVRTVGDRNRTISTACSRLLLPVYCPCFHVAIGARLSQAGIKPPTPQSLRPWKKAVYGICQAAFRAVGEVFHSTEEKINSKHVSLRFLGQKGFTALKHKDPTAQALAVHIMARCGKSDFVEARLGDEGMRGGGGRGRTLRYSDSQVIVFSECFAVLIVPDEFRVC